MKKLIALVAAIALAANLAGAAGAAGAQSKKDRLASLTEVQKNALRAKVKEQCKKQYGANATIVRVELLPSGRARCWVYQ
jgi:hypothetical protein